VVFTSDEIAQVDGIDKPTVVGQEKLGGALACPKCNVAMKSFNYAYTSGVIIDKCPECGGIWLDKDELEHVQILAEEWAKKLEGDKAKYSGVLNKVREQHRSLDRVNVSRFGIMNAFMTGLLRLID